MLEAKSATHLGPLNLRVHSEEWPVLKPVQNAGSAIRFVVVCLEKEGRKGYGEADSVFVSGGKYHRANDRAESIIAEIERVRPAIEAGITHRSLLGILPAGSARNAVDCALWDLEAKVHGLPVWALLGLPRPKALLTTFTCNAASPEMMAEAARAHSSARALKIRLTGHAMDFDRLRSVREARPDVWLGVDAGQSFTLPFLEELLPALLAAGVSRIEQPFPVGDEKLLEALSCPIAIAADESIHAGMDIAQLRGRFSAVNIKLDVCGGLTQGLAMARAAREAGLEVIAGTMMGTSLAIAPSFLVGQLADIVELDAANCLAADRLHRVTYNDGRVSCPETVWGGTH